MILKPREYQLEAIEAIETYWRTEGRRCAVVLPTGMGKTVIFAHLLADYFKALSVVNFIRANPSKKVMILVHRNELVKQAEKKFHDIAPDLSIGIIKRKRDEIGADIIIASIQTLSRENRLKTYNPKMFSRIVVDEAHHAAAPSYMRIIKYFGGFEEWSPDNQDGTFVAGFTATLVRNDSKGLGDIWEKVVYKKDILWGITKGFLCDVRGKRVVIDGLDLSKVRKSGGDFSEDALGEALHDAGIGKAIYNAYVEHGENKQFIAFLPTVATVYEVADYMHSRGIRVGAITGSTTEEDRALIVKMVESKDLDGIINCMVLTEGFDLPQLELAIIARPTQSEGLYVQMVGRVLRTHPGKLEALVLDLVGAGDDNRLASLVDLSESLTAKPRDGESLKEAIDREQNQEEVKQPDSSGEIIDVYDIEMFSARKSAWLRTKRGYWFIPAGQRIYAVLPETMAEDTFTVGYFWSGVGKRDGNEKILEHVALGYGMAWAEQLADEHEPMTARKGASWRKKLKEPATQNQLDFARKHKVLNPEGMTKVELSDAISVKLASDRIDKWEPEEV